MAFLNFIDVSRWQGAINWQQVKDSGVQGAILKISGGDDGLYYDTLANANYYGAKSMGLLVGGYHFAGGTDPIAEAEYFLNGMKPLEEDDVLVLDWEVQHPDPVGWCTQFVNHVHDQTGVWPILYLNGSTRNAYDWSPVTNHCGVWIAWYGKDPNADLPVDGMYVMHQYTSTGSVPGISGNVDEDAVFMSPEQFDSYGYHSAPLTPVIAPIPVIVPVEVTPTIPTTTPVPTPTPVVDNTTPVEKPVESPKQSTLYDSVMRVFLFVVDWLKSWKR